MDEIKYKDIIDLGFNEKEEHDQNYINHYGFVYSIITLNLTDLIYIDWVKETRLCEIIRIDSVKTMNIQGRLKINNLDHLKEMILFFTGKRCTPDYA